MVHDFFIYINITISKFGNVFTIKMKKYNLNSCRYYFGNSDTVVSKKNGKIKDHTG